MNLTALLEERAAKHPERAALIDVNGGEDRVLTYGELAERVSKGASVLKRAGLTRGSTILVFQPVSIELYELLLAAFHGGMRVMLADPSAGRAFLDLCCRRIPPDAFFGSWKAQWLRLATGSLRKISIAWRTEGWFPGARRWHSSAQEAGSLDVPDDEPALVTFTSGSTGVPKAAVRTHGFLLAQHRALSQSLSHREGEVDLVTLPVFVLANLASGMTSVLAPGGFAKSSEVDAGEVLRLCRKYQVTRCAASPAYFEKLLQSEAGVPDFEKIYTGGAPVFPDLLDRLKTAKPEARVEAVYGSTEAEPIAHHGAEELDRECREVTRGGGGLCAGRPVEQIELRVLKDRWGQPLGPFLADEFAREELPPEQVGEIVVAGDHVLDGYLDGVGDEDTKIRVDGRVWHRTGDAGWRDAEGQLWLSGRCSQKLPGDGMHYPFAIECALRERYPTARLAAIGFRGERVLVVERNGIHSVRESLIADAADQFSMTRVVEIDRLPMDRRHHAKIDYPALEALLKSS